MAGNGNGRTLKVIALVLTSLGMCGAGAAVYAAGSSRDAAQDEKIAACARERAQEREERKADRAELRRRLGILEADTKELLRRVAAPE